jgi:hypothetical protein
MMHRRGAEDVEKGTLDEKFSELCELRASAVNFLF